MSAAGAHLALHPERCDHCGRCVGACPEDAVRVGPSYISVDWSRCARCCVCVDTCSRQAIQRAVVPERGAAVGAVVSDTSKVVVGSRAEAKAVRKAAKQATKARGKSVEYAGKAVSFGSRGALAAPVPAAVPAVPLAGAGPSADGGAPSPSRPIAQRPPAAPPKPFVPGAVTWNPTDLFLVLAMLLATVLAKDAVLGLHAVSLMPAAGRTVVRALVLTVYYSLQLAVFAWLATRHRATLAAAFGIAGRDSSTAAEETKSADVSSLAGSVVLVAVLFVGAEAFAITYGLVMRLVMQSIGLSLPPRLSSDLAEVFGSGGAGLALSIVLVALVAPFAEELAFRGVVMPVLGVRWGMWPAIIGSALVYAVFHFTLWLFAPYFVLGLALGWLAWTRRSLGPAIWLHVIYNASAVVAGFLVAR